MKLRSILLATLLCVLFCIPAHALEYDFDAPEDYLFGQPTSDDTIYEHENLNVDRSKNTALAAPGFGSATSYLPKSGEYLTPNLVPGALSGGMVNAVGSAGANATGGVAGSVIFTGEYPSVDTSGTFTVTQIPSVSAGTAQDSFSNSYYSSGYTEVTSDLYYSNGSLGTLEIPAIGLSVQVVQGTDNAALAKGAGHFTETSIWDGNVSVAAHNRGTNNYFGKIHTLSLGDTITLTTKLGTRIYAVASVEKISVNDSSAAAATTDNRITLYTCVMNEPDYRWCVQAV